MSSPSPISLFDDVIPERSVQLATESLVRGIDNYHIDVRLSRRFSSDIRNLVNLLISQLAVPNPRQADNSELFEKLREKYLDLMTSLIHRVQTDLSVEEVALLQFAPIKFTVRYVRERLDHEIRGVSARLAEFRNKGSSDALGAQQRLFWLKKNYDNILYAVNKAVFNQYQRVEERQLGPIREQYLGEDYNFIGEALTNPLLSVAELSALPLLLNEFSIWNTNSENESFNSLNGKLEKLFNKHLKALALLPLKDSTGNDRVASEIHDELGGLLLTQSFLGPAEDTKHLISETLSWFEDPDMVAQLFDDRENLEKYGELKKSLGFINKLSYKRQISGQRKLLARFAKLLRSEKILPTMLASHYMRKGLSATILQVVDLKIVCQYLAGLITLEKVTNILPTGTSLNSEQLRSMENLRGQIQEKISRADDTNIRILLTDISRYRRLLKFYRLSHRAFNRLSILVNEEDIKLSKSAGTLYVLPTSSEVEQDEARICHHAILKADVRGSSTVTDELQEKGLNPASYFSTRFFNPINKILETYGANKVFIEGDAIILSFLEYENAPQQWYSVARACGYARDMLRITSSNNRYSRQMGLPLLELGVGICYSNEAPCYLYDGDHPIMISGAINLADRMSGCSWNLRSALEKGLFSVDVLRIADGEVSKGEKGQHYLRYNINGINIDDMAFAKLKSEVALRSIRMKLNDKHYLFHVGQYPDAKGRKKDLVIREGTIGIWKDNRVLDDPESEESYYEVVVNQKIIPLVLDALDTKKSTAV